MSLTEELLQKGANIVTQMVYGRQTFDANTATTAMAEYYKFLINPCDSSIDPEHLYVFYINAEEVKREIMESLLLSAADADEVYEVFGITPTMFSAYKELFFNVDNLVSRLDIVEYLENYPDGLGKALKIRAFNLGPEFVYFKYGNIVPRNETQKDLVKKMFMASAYKAMESNYSSSSTGASKAATTHASLMLKAYEVMRRLMDGEGDDGLEKLTEIVVATENEMASKKKIAKGDIV